MTKPPLILEVRPPSELSGASASVWWLRDEHFAHLHAQGLTEGDLAKLLAELSLDVRAHLSGKPREAILTLNKRRWELLMHMCVSALKDPNLFGTEDAINTLRNDLQAIIKKTELR